jgi:hypothetical protein
MTLTRSSPGCIPARIFVFSRASDWCYVTTFRTGEKAVDLLSNGGECVGEAEAIAHHVCYDGGSVGGTEAIAHLVCYDGGSVDGTEAVAHHVCY